MIYLSQNNELYNNDIRAMLQAFFDNEKIVCEKEGTRIFLTVTYTYDMDVEGTGEKGGYVNYLLEDEDGYRADKTVIVDFMNKKVARNPLKAALYNLLSEYTHITLPWGGMTGVRPTKIATSHLEEGKSEEEIRNIYTSVYLASEQKADICIEVAKNEQRMLCDYDLKNEYCLYIGIPFCPTRCLYCSFTSYPIKTYKDKVDAYLEALFKDMEAVARLMEDKKRLACIYIGGGTPTSLSEEELDKLLSMVLKVFDVSHVREYTVECGRADSITKGKLEVLKKYGIGRISVNPQTMNEETLKLIGRAATAKETVEAYKLARSMGFDNINMDMITGLPGEDVEDVKRTLSIIKELAPDSLTVHSLAIKRAANLNIEMVNYRSMIKGSTNEMLSMAYETAKDLDLCPYYLYRQKNIPGKLENVGYAKRGKECAYNVLIMEEKMDVMAVGAGASSKFVYHDENRIERVENVKNVDEYISRIDEMTDRKLSMKVSK